MYWLLKWVDWNEYEAKKFFCDHSFFAFTSSYTLKLSQ